MEIADLLLTYRQPDFLYLIFMFGAWQSDILEHGVLLLNGAGDEGTLWGRCSFALEETCSC